MPLQILLDAARIPGGALAAVAGFGIGSVLTPVLAGQTGTKLAAAATGLFVDAARIPVYLATEGRAVVGVWPWAPLATAGVVIGTSVGRRVLGEVAPRLSRPVVAVVLLALGNYVAATALR